MRILVLGGTRFVGRAVVEAALSAGHDVTLFNRGRTAPELFGGVERIVGDRNGDLAGLRGRAFDAVIDPSAYFPRQVTAVIEALGPDVPHYTFVSSVSVYARHDEPGADESAARATVTKPDTEDLDADYGAWKARCEDALDDALPGRAHHVRAGLVVGPADNTRRFTWWVARLARGGRVLAPEPADQPVQIIDVRDLAEWIVRAAEAGVTGPLNATGNPGAHTLGSVLEVIRRVTGERSRLTWVGEDFLIDNGVQPFTDLPLWLPPRTAPTHVGFFARDNARAVAAGLRLRDLRETVAAVRDEVAAGPAPVASPRDYGNALPEPGLAPVREAELLRAWDDRG
jgi:2'-hydroxyisoflavone reductase